MISKRYKDTATSYTTKIGQKALLWTEMSSSWDLGSNPRGQSSPKNIWKLTTRTQPSCNYLLQARSSGKNLASENITSIQKEMRTWSYGWLLNLRDIRKWKKWTEWWVGREPEPVRITERNVMTRKSMGAEECTGWPGLQLASPLTRAWQRERSLPDVTGKRKAAQEVNNLKCQDMKHF